MVARTSSLQYCRAGVKYALFHNDGDEAHLPYDSLKTGLGALTSGSSGWGVGLEDFDNDGWKGSLRWRKSHVLENVEKIDASLPLQRTAALGAQS